MGSINYYPGFSLNAEDLVFFSIHADSFILQAKNGEAFFHKPSNPSIFFDWLIKNNIEFLHESELTNLLI